MANPNPTYKFKKGQSGNPSGRPKGSKHLSTLLFEALRQKARDKNGKETDKTYQELLIQRILKDAIEKGNTSLIHLIYSYIDGSPEQFIDLTTDGESFNEASNDLVEIARKMSAELKKKKTGAQ